MFYFIVIIKNGEKYYVTSPSYGKFALSSVKENLYLWETEESCKKDARWQHLIEDGEVKYYRHYIVR